MRDSIFFSFNASLVISTKTYIFKKNRKISPPPQLPQNTWKYHVDNVRHKAFESTPGDISTLLYYADQTILETSGQLQNELFYNYISLSMEGFCLYCFIKTVNVSSLYDNGGGYVHQSNDTVRDFSLHLSYSKLQK